MSSETDTMKRGLAGCILNYSEYVVQTTPDNPVFKMTNSYLNLIPDNVCF